MASAQEPRTVDLNADLGESFGRWELGDDEAMLAVVTSANVACGFHAGDPVTLRRTCSLAAERGVAIGAQVGYRDRVGFGRRFVDVSPDELHAEVLYQLGALQAMAQVAGTRVAYVKPHGALYNAVVHHEGQARALVEAIADYDPALAVLGLPESVLLRFAADRGLRIRSEAFADRGYRPDGTLQPRGEPGALLQDPEEVAERMRRLVTEGRLAAVDGTDLEISPDSICVHGDSPGAVAMARAVREALRAAGIRLQSFG